MKVAYYQEPVAAFVRTNPRRILGELATSHGFALGEEQRNAWLEQIALLKRSVAHLEEGHILFEFAVPRIGKRVDVVLVIRGILIVIEFKVGSAAFERNAIEQVHDYALDLKNFHRGSHALPIVPVLVATRAIGALTATLRSAADGVAEPLLVNGHGLKDVLDYVLTAAPGGPIAYESWLGSGYQPTPTIIEAAQVLYTDHNVEEIARSDAGAQNLGVTFDCIANVIEHSKRESRKAICLVTGVPGAGKTLAGLNIATKRAHEHSDEHAVFLSGNGPLVAVLREALARDERQREGTSKREAYRKVASFIQNIHHFRDEALRDPRPPHELTAGSTPRSLG
jgi:hypothetical protein